MPHVNDAKQSSSPFLLLRMLLILFAALLDYIAHTVPCTHINLQAKCGWPKQVRVPSYFSLGSVRSFAVAKHIALFSIVPCARQLSWQHSPCALAPCKTTQKLGHRTLRRLYSISHSVNAFVFEHARDLQLHLGVHDCVPMCRSIKPKAGRDLSEASKPGQQASAAPSTCTGSRQCLCAHCWRGRCWHAHHTEAEGHGGMGLHDAAQ